MSVPVALDALREQLERFGSTPYLVTVGQDASAHVASVRAQLDGDAVVSTAGRTSRRNAGQHPAVTLLWPPNDGGPHSLIIDGHATVDDAQETIAVRPSRAVLHRVADGPDDVPTCVTI